MGDAAELQSEVTRLTAVIDRIWAEADRIRDERDRAFMLLSKRSWQGRLDMTDAFHIERGRSLAGFVGGGGES